MSTPALTTLGPVDLFQRSLSEIQRRATARAKCDVGAYVVITHTGLAKDVGEDIVQVVSRSGNDLTIRTRLRRSSSNKLMEFRCRAEQVAPSLATGDRVKVSGKIGVVQFVLPSGRSASGVVPEWGVDGHPADVPALSLTLDPTQTNLATTDAPPVPPALSKSYSPRMTLEGGCFVRGWRGEPAFKGQEVGPLLMVSAFLRVAMFAEPCTVRQKDGKPIVYDHPLGKVALVDFLGGATLMIWVANLVDCEPYRLPLPETNPSTGHRADAEHIALTSGSAVQTAPAPAPADLASAAPGALPDSTNRKALPTKVNDMNPAILELCNAPAPRRDDVIVVSGNYDGDRNRLLEAIQRQWTESQLADCDSQLDDLQCCDPEPGAWIVKTTVVVELPDGYRFTLARCAPFGNGCDAVARSWICTHLCTPVVSQAALATTDGQPGAVARAGGSIKSMVKDAVGDGFSAVKDHAKGAVVRKGTRLLKDGTQGTVVAVHERIRDSGLAIVGSLAGMDDPQKLVNNPVARTVLDELAVIAVKALGGGLDRFIPGAAAAAATAAETLEEGIDRKQSAAVIGSVAPFAQGGLRALAQSFVTRVAPALAAAPTAEQPALPVAKDETPPTPVPADKPTRKRRKKAAPADDTET